MVSIDRMRFRLPPGFEGRADALARRVADRLAAASWGGSRRIGHLAPPPVTWQPGMTDHDLACRIAAAVVGSAAEGGGDGC